MAGANKGKKFNMKPTELPNEWADIARKERREAKAVADKFLRAAETNNFDLVAESLEALDESFDSLQKRDFWKRVLRQHRTVHPDFRSSFLAIWEAGGDHLRDLIDDDLLLLNLLHRFLPPYTGPDVELFRGETAWNRRRRTYGMSWSADREAATCFALDLRSSGDGGSVLLRTMAPSDAIICAPHVLGARRAAEAEYIVDRRRLTDVTVLERFDKRPLPTVEDEQPQPTAYEVFIKAIAGNPRFQPAKKLEKGFVIIRAKKQR